MKLICYLSLGSPSIEQSMVNANHYVDAGCDVIEVDFPAKDPYLDSSYIQSRMKQALAACDDYNEYMHAIEALKKRHPKTEFIVLTYERTIEEIGFEKFVQFCNKNSLHNIICVGDELPNLRQYLIEQGLLISSYVRFHLPKEDINVAKRTNGFIYLQAKSSGEYHKTYKTLDDIITHFRQDLEINNPIYCGVGISTPEDVAKVKAAGADGAFVGSTVLKLQNQPKALKQTIKDLKANT